MKNLNDLSSFLNTCEGITEKDEEEKQLRANRQLSEVVKGGYIKR